MTREWILLRHVREVLEQKERGNLVEKVLKRLRRTRREEADGDAQNL